MKNRDKFIYPDCPACGVDAEANGVNMSGMKTGMFLFKCVLCGSRSEGWFDPKADGVKWTNIDVSIPKWVWLSILHRW